LAEAHARGIIHRDIKPANIYLCRRALEHDVVKVLDFGLVRRVVSDASGAWASVTHADLIAGTPAYLAPEITMGEPVDGRADLYALACVAFWLLTGRLVFPADTVTAMLVAHAQAEPPRPSHFRCLRRWTSCWSSVWRRILRPDPPTRRSWPNA
jgi:serine/threonine-protein kinase